MVKVILIKQVKMRARAMELAYLPLFIINMSKFCISPAQNCHKIKATAFRKFLINPSIQSF